MASLEISAPQDIFLNHLNTKFRAYVGGLGSGKTFVGCLDLLKFAIEHPGTKQGYFGPSYPAIRDIFYPTIEEAAELMGLWVDVKTTNKEVFIYRGKRLYGKIICRSMDEPNTIVGFKIARALVDEIDILPKQKASKAWNKIIARLRLKIPGVINGIGVTTTPEGYEFVYEKFSKKPTKSYSMVQASTYENEEFLPDDYIESLLETYPSQLVKAYVSGDFVNLTSGSVYPDFDRVLNGTDMTLKKADQILRDQSGNQSKKSALHIGMDFNVGKMSAVVHVVLGNDPYGINEFTGLRDTPAMIETIKQTYPDRRIIIYPDASGNSRDTVNANLTDISLLESAGFVVQADASNPAIRDRVNALNGMIHNALGQRKYKINPDLCPIAVEALEQQVWGDNGKPDKQNDKDHPNDAIGYFIFQRYPLTNKIASISRFRV